jgi:hypothetical protein
MIKDLTGSLIKLWLIPYFINVVWEESVENARDSVKTKAAWR